MLWGLHEFSKWNFLFILGGDFNAFDMDIEHIEKWLKWLINYILY